MAWKLKSKFKNTIETIDTNILLRPILQDNEAQIKKAVDFILSHNCNLYVDDSVISEAVYVLEKEGFSRKLICRELPNILTNKLFIYNRPLFAEVFPFYLSHPSLSFEDCYLSFKVAELEVEPVWTFDKKFATQSPSAKLLR